MEVILLDIFNKKYKINNVINNNIIATIGAYDGIHKGHQKLFEKMFEAKESLKTAVITFDIHPDYVLNKRKNYGTFNTISEKEEYFKGLGVDYLIILPTKEIINMSYQDFNKLLLLIGVKKIVLGSDFHYGYKGLGNLNTLSELFEVIEVPTLLYNGEKISSQKIREYLSSGEFEKIDKVTSEKFMITGTVIKGSQVGRKLGFKTANIELNDKYNNLMSGVYAVDVIYDNKTYKGIANIGNNPTINTITNNRLECNIIDFDKDIYGETITVIFKKYLREEKKFSSTKELIEAIEKDRERAKMI